MRLNELFALYGRALKAEELKTWRFDVEKLLAAKQIKKVPNSYPVFELTEEGFMDNPTNETFDALTKSVAAVLSP